MTVAAEIVWRGAVELVVETKPVEVPPELDERVEEVWAAERVRRPEVTNGSLVAVERIDGGTVHGRLVEYRVFLARQRDPELHRLLPLRAIGVSGVVVFADGNVLLGRRRNGVTEYPGAWELVPSGSIDGEAVRSGAVEPLEVLLRELAEEAHIDRDAVSSGTPLGIVHDRLQDGFDICYELHVRGDAGDYELESGEYTQLAALPAPEAESILGGPDAVPTSRLVLELGARR